jgi:hypothetical protein
MGNFMAGGAVGQLTFARQRYAAVSFHAKRLFLVL